MDPELPPPPADPPKRRVPLVVWLPLTLIGIGILVVVATRPLGGGEPEPTFYVVRSAAPGIQLGEVAPGTANNPGDPPLTLSDLDGAPISLAQYDGQPVWIVFWKANCEPCLEEDPAVEAAGAAHADDGLAVIGIDVEDQTALAAEWLADHPVGYPVAVDPTGGFRSAYGIWGEPTHYFLSPDGVIEDRFFGPMDADSIEAILGRIL